jgi:hypothetical protein
MNKNFSICNVGRLLVNHSLTKPSGFGFTGILGIQATMSSSILSEFGAELDISLGQYKLN